MPDEGRWAKVGHDIRQYAIHGNKHTGDHFTLTHITTTDLETPHHTSEEGMRQDDKELAQMLRALGFGVSFYSENENYNKAGSPQMYYGFKITWAPSSMPATEKAA